MSGLVTCACDWPGCQGQCHTGEVCPCHPGLVDVGLLHRALLADESGLHYAICEGKYLEAASLVANEYNRLAREAVNA